MQDSRLITPILSGKSLHLPESGGRGMFLSLRVPDRVAYT
jgi:hypothetical protein